MQNNPQVSITEGGLYDVNGDLMAVGRLSGALEKNFSSEAIVKVRLTYQYHGMYKQFNEENQNIYEFTANKNYVKNQSNLTRFNFISDENNTLVDGFLAHEVSSIVPEAITGEKDATETYTDDDGKEQTRPVYQSIDQSKLVPLLVKALQEALARIKALESK